MQTKLRRNTFDLLNRHKKNLPVYIEGHRGVNKEMEQNTMLSFQKAIEYKLDSIELDVWLTQDKVPVIIHGGDLGEIEDNTDSKGIITSLPFSSLKNIHTKEMSQAIPTLEEVFQLCKDKLFINIEIKDPLLSETFEEVMKLINKYQMHQQIAISSFKHGYYDVIRNFERAGGQPIEFGFLYEPDYATLEPPMVWDVPNVSFNVNQKDITPEFVEKAHKNGNAVLCWFKMKDEENDEIYDHLFKCNVDAICCNQPNKAIEFREKYLLREANVH